MDPYICRAEFLRCSPETITTLLTGYSIVSCSVVADSVRLHGLQPARLLCPWNSPGKNTEWISHSLLQGEGIPVPGIKLGSPALPADSFPPEPPEMPHTK